jgi:threonine-phosphate decarboxylase
VAARHGFAASSILDFSANVNPDGPPPRVRERLAERLHEPGFLERYPDGEYRELAEVLAERLEVDPSAVLISNGATALIRQSVKAASADTAVFPIPAFSEYEAALRAAGTSPVTHLLREEEGFRLDVEALREVLRSRRPGLCLVNNPHNPSGALASRAEMRSLLSTTREIGTTLVVDEAFIDYAPEETVCSEVAGPGLIVIRSLTKFYGIPGLRVGFAVASKDEAGRLAAQIPSWPAGRLDVAAALAALESSDDERARRENRSRRALLEEGLRRCGLECFPSAANFLLIRLAENMPAPIVAERLVRDHRILVRDCSSYEGLPKGRYLRVAVRRPEENERLLAALESVTREI